MNSETDQSTERRLISVTRVMFGLAAIFIVLVVIVPTATPQTPMMASGFLSFATSMLIYWLFHHRLERSVQLGAVASLVNLVASFALAYTFLTVLAEALTG